jgi:hypothetical protein
LTVIMLLTLVQFQLMHQQFSSTQRLTTVGMIFTLPFPS